MGERDEKMLAAQAGLGTDLIRRTRVPEIRIESLEGGFLVMHHDGSYNGGLGPERQVVPNVDSLVSFVQRWANEASNGR